ncbi:hypothetical protein FA13DRAFT_1819134 [Coprinellus micaceus]|uniref:Fungal-type protein kinase domain-containing protein n=1 Tax=Coprinellus micaceus TaxID=71717 RepID=A0A4Y7SJS0_COPMI|nr:hypothetical protein FA13DRAFT_1819134 [Coprinellus micaceus]
MWTPQGFHNRIKLRVVMKKYGISIWYFKSRLELLRSFLDAFVGHKRLFDQGILHRDISVQNILVAVRTENGISTVPSTPLTGTRLYQSISVLRGSDIKPPPPQDYTDDLEAFFYVLCHIVFFFDEEFTILASLKVGFMLGPLPLKELPPYWGAPFKTLLRTFQKVVVKILERKADIRESGQTNDEQKRQAYTELAGDVDGYYEEVKDALSRTIAQLEEEGLGTEETRLQPSSRRATSPSSGTTAPAAPLNPVGGTADIIPLSHTEAILPPCKKRPSERVRRRWQAQQATTRRYS